MASLLYHDDKNNTELFINNIFCVTPQHSSDGSLGLSPIWVVGYRDESDKIHHKKIKADNVMAFVGED